MTWYIWYIQISIFLVFTEFNISIQILSEYLTAAISIPLTAAFLLPLHSPSSPKHLSSELYKNAPCK